MCLSSNYCVTTILFITHQISFIYIIVYICLSVLNKSADINQRKQNKKNFSFIIITYIFTKALLLYQRNLHQLFLSNLNTTIIHIIKLKYSFGKTWKFFIIQIQEFGDICTRGDKKKNIILNLLKKY